MNWESEGAGSFPSEGGATATKTSQGQEIDESIVMKESMKLGLFQTQIIECKTKLWLGESAHVIMTPFKSGEAQPSRAWPLP